MIILKWSPTILSKIHLLALLPIFIIFVQLSMSETILVAGGPNSLAKSLKKMGRLRGNDGSSILNSCDCRKLQSKNFQNVHRNHRIVGGKLASPGQFPYQARIKQFNYTGTNTFEHICGGVLISSHHILTAAHCLASTGVTKNDYQVVLGGDNEETMRTYRVTDFVKHRGLHELAQNDNDIALLKIEDSLGEGVSCDKWVQPICLGGPTFPAGAQCQISGYGITEQDNLSDRLLYATVELHSHETCQQIHNNNRLYDYDDDNNDNDVDMDNQLTRGLVTPQHITKHMLCAGPLNGAIDACFGDSGGGLGCFSKEDQLSYLTGIVSWGKACGSKPSVYTKVSQYKDWINMEMKLMG